MTFLMHSCLSLNFFFFFWYVLTVFWLCSQAAAGCNRKLWPMNVPICSSLNCNQALLCWNNKIIKKILLSVLGCQRPGCILLMVWPSSRCGPALPLVLARDMVAVPVQEPWTPDCSAGFCWAVSSSVAAASPWVPLQSSWVQSTQRFMRGVLQFSLAAFLPLLSHGVLSSDVSEGPEGHRASSCSPAREVQCAWTVSSPPPCRFPFSA